VLKNCPNGQLFIPFLSHDRKLQVGRGLLNNYNAKQRIVEARLHKIRAQAIIIFFNLVPQNLAVTMFHQSEI
jgi:hypothetical protein